MCSFPKHRPLLPIFLAATLSVPAAHAGGAWSAGAEFRRTSDYIYRGFSQTSGRPALQATLNLRHRGGWVGGIWGSNVDFDYDANVTAPRRVELRGFTGFSRDFGDDWSAAAIVVYHDYPDSNAIDGYLEIDVSARFREYLSASVTYSPSVFGSKRSGMFFELSANYPLPLGINAIAGVGRAELDLRFEPHYYYGHVGLSRPFRHFGVELAYYDSDARAIPRWGDAVDGQWVLSISAWIPQR